MAPSISKNTQVANKLNFGLLIVSICKCFLYLGDMYRPGDHPDQKGEPDWVKSERDMFKTYRDKNADGKLDKDELKEWIMPSGFDHAEAEARHLLHLADDNKVRNV